MKYLLLISLTLFLLSCKESNDGFETFYKWNNVNEIVNRDSLINELGFELDLYDGIIINEVNYNLFGDNGLYRQHVISYFNYDNNQNKINSYKINYKNITGNYVNEFYEKIYFKSNDLITSVDFWNYDNNTEYSFQNIKKNYSKDIDTLDGDYTFNFEDYNYDLSSLFLSSILRLNDFDIVTPGYHFTIFNDNITTLSLSSLKSEIEKHYSLSDTIVFIFESQHIKSDTINQDDKKYLIINKEIYPIRLTYLPE